MTISLPLLLALAQDPVPDLEPTPPEEPRFQAWRDNYIQLASWRRSLPDATPAAAGGTNREIETEFQLSVRYFFRADWLRPILTDQGDLFFGYTTRSYWQLYNRRDSRPFRTTEYAPEITGEYRFDDEKWTARFSPFLHQSNGESGAESRSWDRAYAELVWASDPEILGSRHTLKPFDPGAIAQSASVQLWLPWDDTPEDNPDLLDYMGYGQLRYSTLFRAPLRPSVTITGRTNLGSGAELRGAFEIDFSFTLTGVSRFHLQYFRGYGDSLFEYDELVTRYGIGIELIPW